LLGQNDGNLAEQANERKNMYKFGIKGEREGGILHYQRPIIKPSGGKKC
jgi:hypothetical protein